MHFRPLLPAAAALLALAACHNKTEVVDTTAPDPNAEAIKNAAPVKLPPPIEASVTFRCKDNSLVYVDFFGGHEQINLRMKQDGEPMHLTAEAAGKPYKGNGYTVDGTPEKITLNQPGKPELSCKA